MRHSLRTLVLTTVVLSLTGCGYNKLQELDEGVNKAQAQIQTQLQRRADLIPNLVETVKGVAAQETSVFTAVAEARSRLAGAVQSGNLSEMAEANAAMTAPLGRLLAIAEAYPELKSSANFTQLQDQLEGTENRVAVARTDYNAAVEQFNATIRRFPTNLTAKMFGL
jgi:LemA protein